MRPHQPILQFFSVREGRHGPTPQGQNCLGLRLICEQQNLHISRCGKRPLGESIHALPEPEASHMSHPNINSSNHNDISSVYSPCLPEAIGDFGATWGGPFGRPKASRLSRTANNAKLWINKRLLLTKTSCKAMMLPVIHQETAANEPCYSHNIMSKVSSLAKTPQKKRCLVL